MFVLGALELFQRYQALDITRELHWIVVTVANLEAHSRLVRSIRHRLWFVRRVLSCPRLCQHFLSAHDLISATLLAQILHPISTPEQVTEIICVSKSKKAYDKRQINIHFAVAETANHKGKCSCRSAPRGRKDNHHVPDSNVKFMSFYLTCLMSELATECWKKYDVPLVSFLSFCESVAVQGYNMQVFSVGKYLWRFCDIHISFSLLPLVPRVVS